MSEELNTPVEENNPQSLLGGEPTPNEPQEPAEPQPVGTAPDSIDGYEVNVDGFDFDEFKSIDENKEFLERARAAGMDNKGLNFLLSEYNQLIPELMQANAALENEACVKHMSDVWGADTDQNFGFARAAADNAIQNGVLTAEEVNSPEFGNNPLVLKMAAYFGQQLSEDTPPQNTQQTAAQSVSELMKSEAYWNEKHPDHARVYAQVQQSYNKQYKEAN
ncbi:hypothetical protein [Acinetobacter larvae]|uniref:Uncharacterized protein n=1 Tax=Acinetobacter larvae TaxID=1789224 RepID=A0A1B2LXA1_9GAMM|nr:hypothetical protein [Acinetobacter larvae]AOA57567.1 hypothetical protein BFG52_03835 [Acinetobacter larvae]